MRFPIRYKKFGSDGRETREYTNLSTALMEALMDKGIICPKTGNSSQDHFDLPINESSVLSLLSKFYDLEGKFHVGCSYDRRPPSFSFHYERLDSERDGKWYIGYNRELKLAVFQQRNYFQKPASSTHARKGEQVRNLDTLAEAYNTPSNYGESITIGWSGQTVGKEGFLSWFVNLRLSADFNEGKMTTLNLANLLYGIGVLGNQTDPECNPLLSSTKELPLSRIAAEYYPKQDEMRNHSVEEVLSAIGYSPAQVLLGMLQVAERVMPFQKGITLDLGLCEKALKDNNSF